MARSQKEGIVIILDIGHSSSRDIKDVKGNFFENAKNCVSMILKRKIFQSTKDEIALIILGSENTDNTLDYDNIEVVYPFALPSWEMLTYLENLKGTDLNGDWLDAVVLAMNLFKEDWEKKFTEKKVVLLTDLNCDVSEDQTETIVKALKTEDFSLIVIGPDIDLNVKHEAMDVDDYDDKSKHWTNGTTAEKTKTSSQVAGESLLSQILTEAGGVICSFADAVPQLMYFQKKNIRGLPWNCVMDIGPDIKIAVSSYVKIAPASLPSWKTIVGKTFSKDESQTVAEGKLPSKKTTASSVEDDVRIESEKTFIRQDENQTVVEQNDVIGAYNFGTTMVPFSDVDKAMMNYQAGEKCLSVLGFTPSKNVARHLIIGKGAHYITAMKNDESAAVALSALIRAMNELDLVAIARKVYRANTAVRVGALFPRVRNSYECLVFVELPFSEDMREFVFPPLDSDNNKPTREQLDSIDALIDDMDLSSVKNEYGEVTEAFKPKSMLNPYYQHVHHSLAHRALHPEDELPPPNDYVKNLLKSPFENKPSYKLAVEEVKKRFQLLEIKEKKITKTAAEIFKAEVKDDPQPGPSNVNLKDVTIKSLFETAIVEVGTVKPVEDFESLLERGEKFEAVCSQMQKVITNLVLSSFGNVNFPKAETALRCLRSSCVSTNPTVYNDWLPLFRDSLFERARKEFWDLIVNGNLGLITSHENSKSSVTENEAKTFLNYVEPKVEEKEEEPAETFDEDELLDQM